MSDKPFELPEHDPDEKVTFPPRPLGSKSCLPQLMSVAHRRSGKTAMVAINTAPTPEIRELMKRVFEDDQGT